MTEDEINLLVGVLAESGGTSWYNSDRRDTLTPYLQGRYVRRAIRAIAALDEHRERVRRGEALAGESVAPEKVAEARHSSILKFPQASVRSIRG